MPKSNKYPTGVKPSKDGVSWKIVAYAINGRTGVMDKKKTSLPISASLSDAVRRREELIAEIRAGGALRAVPCLTVLNYAESWIARVLPRLPSLTTQERYKEALYNHILPDLGNWDIRKLDKVALEEWLVKPRDRYELIRGLPGKTEKAYEPTPYSPETVNGWWRILKQMLRDAVDDIGLQRDPTMRVAPLPARIDPDQLGDELVNCLTAAEVVRVLLVCKTHYPQWFGFVVLGFAIGARTGELRPIRWGKDLDADSGRLTIRRSQRSKHLGPTKTKKARSFILPDEIMTVLKEHRLWLLRNGHPAADGELVFPRSGKYWRAKLQGSRFSRRVSATEAAGQFWSKSALDKPLTRMVELAKIKRSISTKVFRRSFNKIALSEAVLNNVVTRSVTGHSSIEMQELYGGADLNDRSKGLATVTSIFVKQTTGKGLVQGLPEALFGAIPDLPRQRKKARSG